MTEIWLSVRELLMPSVRAQPLDASLMTRLQGIHIDVHPQDSLGDISRLLYCLEESLTCILLKTGPTLKQLSRAFSNYAKGFEVSTRPDELQYGSGTLRSRHGRLRLATSTIIHQSKEEYSLLPPPRNMTSWSA